MKKKLILKKEVIASLSDLEKINSNVAVKNPTFPTTWDTSDTCDTCVPYSLDACRTVGCQ